MTLNFEDLERVFMGQMNGMFNVRYDVYIGESLAEQTTNTLPEIFAKQHFMEMVQSIANEDKPMRVEMHVPYKVFDDNNNYIKTLDNYIEFKNNLYDK